MAQMHDGRDTAALAQIEKMMVAAYDAVLGKVNKEELHASLERMRHNHQDHAGTLDQMLEEMDPRPAGVAAVSEFAEDVLENVGKAARPDDALGRLQIAEASLRLQYAEAIDRHAEDEQVRRTLEQLAKDEREHVAYLTVAVDRSRT